MARLLALGLCAAGALAGKGKKYEDHTMDALAWLKENTPSTLIVDVRTKAEYETGHLEGAVHVQAVEMELCYEKYKEIQKSVSVYCYEKPYRSTPVAEHLSEKFPGLRVVDLGGLAYMEGAHLVTNGTDAGAMCMVQPTSRPTSYPGEPKASATLAPVAAPTAAEAPAEAAADASGAAAAAAAVDDEASEEASKASAGGCLLKLVAGAALVVALGSAAYYYRRRKSFKAKMAPILEATPAKGEVQVAAPADSKLPQTKEAEDALHVQIAPEGAAAAAPAEDVEKGTAELMTVDTEGLPESPAYEV